MQQEQQKNIPSIIFIVPYRERPEQMHFFCKYMEYVLKDEPPNKYEIYFSHQYDAKPFSRGSVKNIGFISCKTKYPDHYKDITFVFNDIDCVPYKNLFDYETEIGTVKHFYGFRHSLGGIVSIKGFDFELINGFPCYYGWGKEDHILQKRAIDCHLIIDRQNFYEIGSRKILHLFDGINRVINKNEIKRSQRDDKTDGIKTISNVFYSIDTESKNPKDKNFIIEIDKPVFVINIYKFDTKYNFNTNDFTEYDLRKPIKTMFNKENKKVVSFVDSDWKRIPNYYKDDDNNTTNINTSPTPIFLQQNSNATISQPQKPYYQTYPNYQTYQPQTQLYSQVYRNPASARDLYSQDYAVKNRIPPRASTSVNIKMGGVVRPFGYNRTGIIKIS